MGIERWIVVFGVAFISASCGEGSSSPTTQACISEADSAAIADPDFWVSEDAALPRCFDLDLAKSDGPEAVQGCFESTGLSHQCASSYTSAEECWRQSCRDLCNSGDPGCASCAENTNCFSDFELSAGIPFANPQGDKSTHVGFYCHSTPAVVILGGSIHSTCDETYTYNLGKFDTKEFRFHCDQRPNTVSGASHTGQVTCTILDCDLPTTDYCSKSCTNWDLTSDHHVTWNSITCAWAGNIPASTGTWPRNALIPTSQAQILLTINGWYLFWQSDGNLVLYHNGQPSGFSSNTVGSGRFIAFQDDGNLVIYDINHQPIWSTGTVGVSGPMLYLFSNGSLNLQDSNGNTHWDWGP